jgi:hypothetical protein
MRRASLGSTRSWGAIQIAVVDEEPAAATRAVRQLRKILAELTPA